MCAWIFLVSVFFFSKDFSPFFLNKPRLICYCTIIPYFCFGRACFISSVGLLQEERVKVALQILFCIYRKININRMLDVVVVMFVQKVIGSDDAKKI